MVWFFSEGGFGKDDLGVGGGVLEVVFMVYNTVYIFDDKGLHSGAGNQDFLLFSETAELKTNKL